MKLLPDTKMKLEKTRKNMTLREIASKAGVRYDWLSSFAMGRIENPGVVHLQRLNDYMTRSLAVKKSRMRKS